MGNRNMKQFQPPHKLGDAWEEAERSPTLMSSELHEKRQSAVRRFCLQTSCHVAVRPVCERVHAFKTLVVVMQEAVCRSWIGVLRPSRLCGSQRVLVSFSQLKPFIDHQRRHILSAFCLSPQRWPTRFCFDSALEMRLFHAKEQNAGLRHVPNDDGDAAL